MKLCTMKEVCAETGLSYDTLKFYCNEGLVPNLRRDAQNRRRFSEKSVAWIKSLQCLRNCGMSLAEMKDYMQLCIEGEQTIPQRKAVLARKAEELKQKIAAIQESIEFIDWKQGLYDDIMSGKAEYQSNLIEDEE